MCILFKFDYANLELLTYVFQKLSKKNLCGFGSTPLPLVQEGLTSQVLYPR